MMNKGIQEVSEVVLFNTIGDYAESKGYYPVYFTSDMPGFIITDTGVDIEPRTMQYIHLIKEYDEFNVASACPIGPYYELWDTCDTERFMVGDEDQLLNRMKELL